MKNFLVVLKILLRTGVSRNCTYPEPSECPFTPVNCVWNITNFGHERYLSSFYLPLLPFIGPCINVVGFLGSILEKSEPFHIICSRKMRTLTQSVVTTIVKVDIRSSYRPGGREESTKRVF